jgi:plastocyanin
LPNRVAWTNADEFGHTVTSKDGYAGVISGKFDSNIQLGS